MNKQEFLEYVASFNPDYAPSGKDFIEQAKKIKRDQLLTEIAQESQDMGLYEESEDSSN